MKIMIIRHAEPDYSIDSLTEKGFKEAKLLSLYMKDRDIDDFYCSPLGRAKDTAAPTMEYFKDKKAALFYNDGLIANFLGYDILYTNEFDNELGVDIQEYLVLNYEVLKVCNN